MDRKDSNMALNFNTPNAPRLNIAKQPTFKVGAPKLNLPETAKAPKPFEPRQRRFNPAPNKNTF